MPEIHRIGRYNGGNVAPSAANPIYAQWSAANTVTNGGVTPDLAALCFDHSSRRRAQAGSGASYSTCFTMLEHFNADRSQLMYKFGDSGLRLELFGTYRTTTGRQVQTLRGHGEISALVQAINSVVLPDNDYRFFVTRLYTELSPCQLCGPQLAPYIGNSVLMDTYTYGDVRSMDRWVSDNQAGIWQYGGTFRP